MFTPLPFYWAGLNGLRLDWMTERTQVSVIGSRVSRPGYPHGPHRERPGEEFRDLTPVYILGGHAERTLGLLHLGATYVNIRSTNVDQGKEELRGSLPISRAPADILAIKVADESPQDISGWGDEKVAALRAKADAVEPAAPEAAAAKPAPRAARQRGRRRARTRTWWTSRR